MHHNTLHDTKIFVVANTERVAYKKANGVLTKIEQYMSKNMLHINVGKSCYMVFTTEHGAMTCARARTYDMNKESNLYLCGTRLNRENEVKFLGVMIDDRLKWDSHIDFLERKLNSCIIIIKRIKYFIPKYPPPPLNLNLHPLTPNYTPSTSNYIPSTSTPLISNYTPQPPPPQPQPPPLNPKVHPLNLHLHPLNLKLHPLNLHPLTSNYTPQPPPPQPTPFNLSLHSLTPNYTPEPPPALP